MSSQSLAILISFFVILFLCIIPQFSIRLSIISDKVLIQNGETTFTTNDFVTILSIFAAIITIITFFLVQKKTSLALKR